MIFPGDQPGTSGVNQTNAAMNRGHDRRSYQQEMNNQQARARHPC